MSDVQIFESDPSLRSGDMPTEEFLEQARAVMEWIGEYLGDPEVYPALSRVRPGGIRNGLPGNPPESGDSFDQILRDFQDIIVPGVTHWNHPGFFGYFGISGSAPGVLGEALTAALNVNAMLWRTSPAATELEEVALDWLRQLLGLPPEFRGHIQDTASTSTMVAMAAAREAAGFDVRLEGLAGRDLPRLRVYASDQAHSSVDKAAITLGFGMSGVRRIAADEQYRMPAAALAEAIDSDIAEGVHPVCVIATIGTTSTSSVDPIAEIADVCRARNVWLHVDGAYGGAASILPSMRPLMRGWERADSIVVNPHKWLFVPIDCSALYLKQPEKLVAAWSLLPEYLTTPEGDSVTNLMDYGPALGRRFRSLKLWMILRYFGRDGIAARIAEHIRIANVFKDGVVAEPGWELMAPVPFSLVCFRYAPPDVDPGRLNELNELILERVNASGDVFLSHTRLNGRFAIRLAVGNIRSRERHVLRAWELLREAGRGLVDS